MPPPRPSSPPVPGLASQQAAALPPGLTGAGGARGRAKPPRHLADLSLPERRAAVAELGERPFRADQLSRQYFARLADEPGEMTDLPRSGRQGLADALLPRLLTAERELQCDGGTTRKTLWRTFDHAYVESVLMRYPGRVTMCVSSQAGCGMACPFCATGQAGADPQPVHRRDRRAGRGRCPRARPWSGAGRPGPGLQRGLHGHG